MAMEDKTAQMPHKLILEERKKLSVAGVSEVVSFDETSVVLRTVRGTLLIRGRELQLKNLSQEGGQVAVEGTVELLAYEEPRKEGGLLARLFG